MSRRLPFSRLSYSLTPLIRNLSVNSRRTSTPKPPRTNQHLFLFPVQAESHHISAPSDRRFIGSEANVTDDELEAYHYVLDAILAGDLAAFKKILAKYPDINLSRPHLCDDPGWRFGAEPLICQPMRARLARKPDDLEIITLLLKHGCDINADCDDCLPIVSS